MKKAIIKSLSVVLAVVLTLTAAPLSGFVGLELPEWLDFSIMSRAATSGTCGENLTWTFDGATGTLTISGTGEMNYFDRNNRPWEGDEDYIKKVVIKNGVTSIGYNAFYSCASLTSVTIPDSVTIIATYAFSDCTSLTSVTIPDSVTTIGAYAFSDCTSLTSVTIPDSVTSIGNYAFYRCYSLTSITVDNNNQHFSSDEYGVLFNKDKTILIQYPVGNTRIKYKIPDTVTLIGYYAFYYCQSLTGITIPDSVTSIGNSAFAYCESLTSVTIPDNVTSIGYYAFYDTAYYNDTNNWEDNVLYIGNHLIDAYTSGDYEIKHGTLTIAVAAFRSCTSLTSVIIPNSVITIDSLAFEDCESLVSVTIGNSVTSIGSSAFSGCTSLTSITIPDSVTSIGNSAFRSCTSLTNITIPDSVTTIGDYTFSGCTSLSVITIPDSVTSIGGAALYDTAYYNDTNNWEDNVLYISNHLIDATHMSGDYKIKHGTLTIAGVAFYNCAITSITIPDSVTTIGVQAFAYCASLTSITIPNSVTSIVSSAFYNCTSLTDVYYSGTEEQWNEISIGSYNECLTNATIHYNSTGPDSDGTDVEIFFGTDENGFGEDITGYVGEEVEATLIYKNSENNTSALDISSSNTDVVELGAIRIGSGDYNNEVERDAYVTLKLKSAGTSTIIITSPEGISESVNVIVNESSYELKLYCEIPVMTVAKGDSIGAALQLEKNSTVYTGESEYSFAVSNPTVLSVSNIREENNTVLFSINGLSEGLSKIIVTETISGTVYSATVQVTNGVLTFNAEALPSYYDKKFEYNGYIGGMYIDEFKVGETKDGMTDISFNVYNSSCIVGVVDIYDASGKLYKSEAIERFDGGFVTGIGDTLWNGWRMLEDLAKGELLTYKQESYSKKTPFSIQVPAGGRIEITNDIQYSDACAILNASEFAITTLLLFSETITNIKDAKPIAKESSLAILKSCALEKIPEIGNEFKKALMSDTLKQLTVDGITSAITDVTDSCVAVFDLFEIDFTKIVLKCAKDVGIGIAEEAFQKATSIFGAVLDGMFTFSKYCDLSSFIVQLSKQRINHALAIYLNDENGCLVDNGTTIKPDDENSSLSESNFVLHSVVLSKDKDISPEIKQSLDEISSEYVVRDIYMERDGMISQPGQTVQVYIPVPDNYNPANCTLYWVKEDGSLEKVPFTVIGNNIVFKTDHFSYWAIVHNTNEIPVEPEYNYTFSIQSPSRIEIRNKDGIILHANVEGNAPDGTYVRWESSNGNFDKSADGSNLKIVAKNKGWTTFTAILCDADGNELARDSVEMYSKSGFFDKIGGFFRGLFGLTKIYEN